MKKLVIWLIATACLLLIVPLASPQLHSAGIKAKVDSNFLVGDIQLPAGEYTFTLDTSQTHMHITNVDTHESITVFVQDNIDNSTPTKSKLVFQNDRSQLVLHRVWSDRLGHVYDILHAEPK